MLQDLHAGPWLGELVDKPSEQFYEPFDLRAKLLEVSVATGALLGGANPRDVKQCETFANDIGIAFQVADDILDVTESSQTLGKPAFSDDALNKNTFPKLMGLVGAQQHAEALLTQALALLEEADLATELLTNLAERSVKRRH